MWPGTKVRALDNHWQRSRKNRTREEPFSNCIKQTHKQLGKIGEKAWDLRSLSCPKAPAWIYVSLYYQVLTLLSSSLRWYPGFQGFSAPLYHSLSFRTLSASPFLLFNHCSPFLLFSRCLQPGLLSFGLTGGGSQILPHSENKWNSRWTEVFKEAKPFVRKAC